MCPFSTLPTPYPSDGFDKKSKENWNFHLAFLSLNGPARPPVANDLTPKLMKALFFRTKNARHHCQYGGGGGRRDTFGCDKFGAKKNCPIFLPFQRFSPSFTPFSLIVPLPMERFHMLGLKTYQIFHPFLQKLYQFFSRQLAISPFAASKCPLPLEAKKIYTHFRQRIGIKI